MPTGLLNNSQLRQLRENTLKRNLYTPNTPYEIDNPKLVKAINLISDIINPGAAFDVTSTVLGRALRIGPQTPIVQIGNQQLAKAFALQIARLAETNILPTININSLFDGDPTTKLLTKKPDYDITVDAGVSKLQRFIQEVTGVQTMRTPFNSKSSSVDYIRNTGKGQLNILVSQLNRNIYRPSNSQYLDAIKAKGLAFKSINAVLADKKFIDTSNLADNPEALVVNNNIALNEIALRARNQDRQDANEYGISKESIADFGKTNTAVKTTDLIDPINYGFQDDVNNDIIWGSDDFISSIDNKFSVRKGLLSKTDAILKSAGKRNIAFDQTKPKLIDKNGTPMFNGTPFRQSTKQDQYDRYEKAIRFKGNELYVGVANSTINKTVIPKFTPLREGTEFNNRNLVFSLENLAYVVNSNGDTGIPLEVGSDINGNVTKVTKTLFLPKTEIGDNGGRLMWFMPYDVKLNENAISRHESTFFIGRSEPIYTWVNAERTATLSFMVLIDYPPQVYGKNHNDIARFFAVGDNGQQLPNLNDQDISNKEKRIDDLKKQRNEIKPLTQQVTPDFSFARKEVLFYFPNDIPSVGDALNTIVGQVISSGYENGLEGDIIDGNVKGDTGLNKDFETKITDLITNELTDEKLKYYKITFFGGSTKLHDTAYNQLLSERRVKALRSYFEGRFATIKNKTLTELGFSSLIKEEPLGDTFGSAAGDKPENMNIPSVKTERYGKVVIEYNGATQTVNSPITPEQQASVNEIDKEIDALKTEISVAQQQLLHNDFVQRKITDKISKGFQDVDTVNSEKRIVPAFHSYTPEDYHRRLTFLQQCTRQGSSLIKKLQTKEGILTSKNSAFGRQPVCVLRLGDFFHSKIIIDNINIDYETPWDLNPEGMGMQPMIARIDMNIKIIGGQSLDLPIDIIQNAESFNYYANSTFYGNDVYQMAKKFEQEQRKFSDSSLQETRKTKFGDKK